MKTISKINVRMPDLFLPLIVNGDNAGLTDEDMKNFLDFADTLQKRADELNCFYDIVQIGDEAYFTWHPEFGSKGCNVIDCVVLFMRPE